MIMMQDFGSSVGKSWVGSANLLAMASRAEDKAWAEDNKPTNPKLRDGGTVELLTATKGHFSTGYFLVPAGTSGQVISARTPRVCRSKESRSAFFSNVDVVIDGVKGRIRVPHGVLKIVKV